MTWRKVFWLCAVIGASIGGWACYVIWVSCPLAGQETLEIEIPKGLTGSSLVPYLTQQGILLSAPSIWILDGYARFYYRSNILAAGVYELLPNESFHTWVEKWSKGIPKLFEVTVPEGQTIKEIATRLHDFGILEDVEQFLALANSPNWLSQFAVEAPTAEGYLFPSTYKFSKRTTAENILAQMLRTYHAEVGSWTVQHAYLPNPYAYLILASLIEKETGVSYEREDVSGVFHNRLAQGMRLQSDPTVIYGLSLPSNTRLRRADLLQPTSHNTYVISGLPPSPICNPGLASIRAAYRPNFHRYLYFVSKNDGSHVFSETLTEHNRFVDIYQKRMAAAK